MLYLITQFDHQALENKDYAAQTSALNDKLQELQAKLLLHSDQLEFFIYGLEERFSGDIDKLCEAFAQYSQQIAQAEFFYDLFTQEEIEESGNFSEAFISALKAVENSRV